MCVLFSVLRDSCWTDDWQAVEGDKATLEKNFFDGCCDFERFDACDACDSLCCSVRFELCRVIEDLCPSSLTKADMLDFLDDDVDFFAVEAEELTDGRFFGGFFLTVSVSTLKSRAITA
eukprot:gene6479-biopygen7463